MIQPILLLLCSLWVSHATSTGREKQTLASTSSAISSHYTVRSSSPADSATAHELIQVRMSEFHAMWQRAWRASEAFRERFIGMQNMNVGMRLVRQHCHPDGTMEFFGAPKQGVTPDSTDELKFIFTVIRSKHSYFATCPSWILAQGVEEANDESQGRDGALLPAQRLQIHEARRVLLAEMDSVARLWPNNVWVTGQRTRLLLDQNDMSGALSVAESCKGASWWCQALVGYVHARNERYAAAASVFAAMHKVMPDEVACKWDDVRNLLEARESGSYAKLNCQERAQINRRFWWLSDPLFRTPVNERRVEDDMRRVEIELHKATGQDERYTWDEKSGGDALTQLIERYGWPTYTANMTVFGGGERGHTGYLNTALEPTPRMAPYTTFEYTMDRVHSVPKWSAIESPFTMTDSAWVLRGEFSSGEPKTDWWPAEHFHPERQILQLFEGQTGMFRRQTQVLMASALQLKHPGLVTSTDAKYGVMLMASTGPGHLDSLSQVVASAGGTVTLQGLIAPTPHVVAIEAMGALRGGVDARSRFGVTPPLPLDSMRPGDIAVSDPVLLSGSAQGSAVIPSEDLLEQMMGTTRLNGAMRRVGLYWETYGLSATDTVKVFVRVVGARELGIAQRLAVATNIRDNPNGSIVQEWVEPDAQRGTRTLEGVVPVQMRTIVLNLSQLEPGPYRVEVGVERKDGTIVFGQRRITIDP